ncbi:MAG TPA: SpoIIE family protein phosphatase [Caldimonas sp.]|nr:SpoIIE family protein phosphatase [Caldimonas sp.]
MGRPRTDDAAARHARFVSLRVRLLGLVALVLVPWLALVLYTQADERRAAVANVDRDAMRVLELVTSQQEAQIEAARQLLAALARLPQLRSPDTCSALLKEMQGAYPRYMNLIEVDAAGDVTCSAAPMRGRVQVSDRAYFQRVMATRRFAVGDYQIGRITQLPAINYAYPIYRADGNLETIVVAVQDLAWLAAAVTPLDLPADAILILTDPNGAVLARIPADQRSIGQPVQEHDVLAALANDARHHGVLEADDAQGTRRLWVHAPAIAGVNVGATIGMSRPAAFAEIDRRLKRHLMALAVVTVLAITAVWFGARRLLAQVDTLVAATRRLASGDLGARVNPAGERNELDQLARSFDTMAARLQARERDLRAAEEKARIAEVELAVTGAQLEIAKQIQQALLPHDQLTSGGVRYAGRCIPAAAVGGDYFGYFARAGNRVDSFVGDVSGHGVGAALLMAEARTTFLAERLSSSSAADLLAKLNALLYDDLDRAGHFMTACCATFDATRRELSYANAGHPPAILLRSNESRCTTISADGAPLGMSSEPRYEEVKLGLSGGDIIVFYTDGITEQTDTAGAFFGVDRLKELIVAHRDDEPEAIIEAVFSELNRFASAREHEDDLTIVVMKRLRDAPSVDTLQRP